MHIYARTHATQTQPPARTSIIKEDRISVATAVQRRLGQGRSVHTAALLATSNRSRFRISHVAFSDFASRCSRHV
jgi:hypothetical protein